MALTLPYPDLDFVPLDILTAEEMNEIVANYTYIANQFPIGGSNLDLGTLNKGAVNASLVTVPYNSYADVVTLDVSGFPDSTMLQVSASARLQWDSSTITFLWRFADQDDTGIGAQIGYIPAQTWGFVGTLDNIIEKTATLTTIKLQFQKQDNSGTPTIPASAAVLAAQVVSV